MQFEPKSLHKYLYANANPIILVDPSGNISILQITTGLNVLGNIQGYGSIGVNILTGNYAVAAGQLAEEVVYGKLGALGRPLSKLSERGLNLFYNIFGRSIKLSKGVAVTGPNLALNLKKVGVRRPPNTQAHHIVAGGADGAADARRILDDFDIDLNAPNNGVFLPKNATSPAGGSFHSGPHPPAYYEEVNARIVAAASGGKIEVLNELGKIKIDLLQGLLPVRY